MVHIWLLIWFLIIPGQQNTLHIERFTSQEACEIVGGEMNAASEKAMTDKTITTFGGTCYEVLNSNNGST